MQLNYGGIARYASQTVPVRAETMHGGYVIGVCEMLILWKNEAGGYL